MLRVNARDKEVDIADDESDSVSVAASESSRRSSLKPMRRMSMKRGILGLRHRLVLTPDQEMRRNDQVDEFVEEMKARTTCRLRVRRAVSAFVTRKLEVPSNVVKLIAVGCVVWIAITTFCPQPVGLIFANNGTLCPRVTVCAETWHALLLLGISRSGAYFCYPFIMLLFLTKTNNLRTQQPLQTPSARCPRHVHGHVP